MHRLSVALPDSALSDEQTKREKTVKIGQFARSCSIFRVNRIYIYHDSLSRFDASDARLMSTVLRYLDTPQYLRKRLFPRISELEYAGILHPIKAPHHKPAQTLKEIRRGDVRSGVLVEEKGTLFVDVGLGTLLPFKGQGRDGQKVDVVFVSEYPRLNVRQAQSHEIKDYWGFDVQEQPSLTSLLSAERTSLVLLTSRKGPFYTKLLTQIEQRLREIESVLLIFGSPKYGIQEILARENLRGADRARTTDDHITVNMFPNQATETIRLEEAVLGTLAILNLSINRATFTEKFV